LISAFAVQKILRGLAVANLIYLYQSSCMDCCKKPPEYSSLEMSPGWGGFG